MARTAPRAPQHRYMQTEAMAELTPLAIDAVPAQIWLSRTFRAACVLACRPSH